MGVTPLTLFVELERTDRAVTDVTRREVKNQQRQPENSLELTKGGAVYKVRINRRKGGNRYRVVKRGWLFDKEICSTGDVLLAHGIADALNQQRMIQVHYERVA